MSRKPFSKSPKNHKKRTVDYKKSKESIFAGLNLCIESWCDKH